MLGEDNSWFLFQILSKKYNLRIGITYKNILRLILSYSNLHKCLKYEVYWAPTLGIMGYTFREYCKT